MRTPLAWATAILLATLTAPGAAAEDAVSNELLQDGNGTDPDPDDGAAVQNEIRVGLSALAVLVLVYLFVRFARK